MLDKLKGGIKEVSFYAQSQHQDALPNQTS